MPSPICTVNNTILPLVGKTGYNASPGSTITLALVSSVDVSSWEISATSADEKTDLIAINNSVLRPTPYSATFVLPNLDGYRGAAIQFSSTVNNGHFDRQAVTFGIFVLNANGSRLYFGGETNESNATVGNAADLNQQLMAIVNSGTFAANGDLSGTSLSQTVIALQGEPVSAVEPGDGYALIYNGGTGTWTPSAVIATFAATNDLSGNNISQTVIGIQNHPVSATAPTSGQVLEYNGSSYVPALLSDASIASAAAIAGSKITPNFGSQNLQTTGIATVGSLKDTALSTGVVHSDSVGNLGSSQIVNADVNSSAAIAVSKLASGSSAQILQMNGSPTWNTVSGDLSLSATGAATVSALQNVAVAAGTPSDGYVLTYKAGGTNKWTAEPITSGSVTLGGDVTGPVNANTVSALQGNPVISTALGFSDIGSSLIWDGYTYQNQNKVIGTVIGKSPQNIAFSARSDDAPAIQEWITANPNGGKLNLINVNFRTAVNFQPLAGTFTKLLVHGELHHAVNKAEIDLPFGVSMEGAGGGGISGGATFVSLEGVNAYIRGWNHLDQAGAQETNNLVTDGYVSGFEYCWQMFTGQNLPDTVVGQTMSVTAVTGSSSFIGANTYTVIAVLTNASMRVAWTGPGTAPLATDSCTAVHWNIGGSYSGVTPIGGLGGNFARIPLLRVSRCKNLTANSFKHWMSLNNTNNAPLSERIFRIMGILNSSTAYVIGYNYSLAGHALSGSLPDYGIGGNSGSPLVTAYEAFPVIRMIEWSTISNIGVFLPVSPVFVMDAVGAVRAWNTINNCMTQGNSPAYVPFINDGVFWFNIDHPWFSPGTSCNEKASFLLTGTDGSLGQYAGIGNITNGLLQNYMIVTRQDSQFQGLNGLKCTNLICDGIQNYWNLGYNAMLMMDGAAQCINLNDSAGADGFAYQYECVYPEVPGTYRNLSQDVPSGDPTVFAPMFGPTLANTNIDAMTTGANFTYGTAWNWSGSGQGYGDFREFGRNSDFSPVVTLPHQIALPALATVANWNALSANTGVTFSTVDTDGYALLGPDLSSGSMIRLSGAASVQVIQWSVSSPQLNDVILLFMRCRSSNAPTLLSGGVRSLQVSGGGVQFFGQSLVSPFDSTTVARMPNEWVNIQMYAKVSSVTSGTATFQFFLSGGNSNVDLIVDPESFSICYIPANATGVENVPVLEAIRLYRKLGGQVKGATPGDVAIPGRMGLSFGSLGRINASANFASGGQINVPSIAVANNQIIGNQKLAIPMPDTDGYVNQMYNVLKMHGLVYNSDFQPGSVSGLLAWYQSEASQYTSSSGIVSSLPDITNGVLKLPTPGPAPTSSPTLLNNEQNYHYAMNFDGTDDKLAGSSTTFTQPFDLWVVMKPLTNSSQSAVIVDGTAQGLWISSGRNLGIGASPVFTSQLTTGYNIVKCHFEGASSTITIGSGSPITYNAGAGSLASIQIGGWTSGFLGNFNLCEFGVYNSAAGGYNATTVYNGLALKYNL